MDVVELGCGTAYVSAWPARMGARPSASTSRPAGSTPPARCRPNRPRLPLPHGEVLRLLRSSGFTVDDLIGIQAPTPANRECQEVSSAWASQWPSEEIREARLTSGQVRQS
ncbi:hypothetical protein ACQPYE_01435 [Actinosynnema sp. CA-299493]